MSREKAAFHLAEAVMFACAPGADEVNIGSVIDSVHEGLLELCDDIHTSTITGDRPGDPFHLVVVGNQDNGHEALMGELDLMASEIASEVMSEAESSVQEERAIELSWFLRGIYDATQRRSNGPSESEEGAPEYRLGHDAGVTFVQFLEKRRKESGESDD